MICRVIFSYRYSRIAEEEAVLEGMLQHNVISTVEKCHKNGSNNQDLDQMNKPVETATTRLRITDLYGKTAQLNE